MISLVPGEIALLVMRRHWIVFVAPTAVFLALLLTPPIAFLVGRAYLPALALPAVRPVANFFLALYSLAILAYLLVRWIEYYLDVWVITSERIIDIEQKTLFHREISEMPLDRIQNVTVEIPGFLATVLGFGNVKIQTAGAGEFTVSEVAEFNRAKEVILQHARRAQTSPTPEVPPDAGTAADAPGHGKE